MGLNSTDTYGAGTNASRTLHSAPEDIDPWLCVWNSINSYFDRGDPDVGPPNNADGVRSPAGGYDSVDNRVIVREQDLMVLGASYYYGIHLVHEGEALANRGDNTASRGFTPSFGGTGWNSSQVNSGSGQVYGSAGHTRSGQQCEWHDQWQHCGRAEAAVEYNPCCGECQACERKKPGDPGKFASAPPQGPERYRPQRPDKPGKQFKKTWPVAPAESVLAKAKPFILPPECEKIGRLEM
jgi:hypothetical protein